jgi:hypothetical protein
MNEAELKKYAYSDSMVDIMTSRIHNPLEARKFVYDLIEQGEIPLNVISSKPFIKHNKNS